MWVIFGGLLAFGLVLGAFVVPIVASNPAAILSDPFGLIIVVFLVLFVATAFLSLQGKRWTLALAAGVSIFFLLLFGPFIAPILANPVSPVFPLAMAGLPALVLSAIFSVLSLVNAKKGIAQVSFLRSPNSSGGLFTTAVIGFVIGGLIVGNIAGNSIQPLLVCPNPGVNICIVAGAASGPAGGVPAPFSPAAFTIPAGTTVTWLNSDTTQHTVTSNTSGLFDSGLLGPGVRWSHTFTQPGTYEYHCEPHAMSMWGTIVVT